MPHVELPQAEFKVALLGDTNAGKTSLVLRFAEGYYCNAPRSSTVGAFFITKRIQTSNGITCKIQIWDTAGQAKFRPMAPMYYRNAAAAIICYDVTSAHSYKVMREWLDELHRNVPAGSIVIAIAATKCDLPGAENIEPVVSFSEAKELAQTLGAIYVDTSAKENTGVIDLFQKVAERVLRFHKSGSGLPVTPGASINKKGEVINGESTYQDTRMPTLDEGRELVGHSNLGSRNFVVDSRRERNEDSHTDLSKKTGKIVRHDATVKKDIPSHDFPEAETSRNKSLTMCAEFHPLTCGFGDTTTRPGVICEEQGCAVS